MTLALPQPVLEQLRAVVGPEHVRTDADVCLAYGTDALKRGHAADAVVTPANTAEVAGVMRVCFESGTPIVPRGAGTGYTGGSVPVHGGVVCSLEHMNRILEID